MFHDEEALRLPRRKEGLIRERDGALDGLDVATNAGGVEAMHRLHELRRRTLLRIAARDLARLGTLAEITLELSHAADVFLDGALRVVWRQQTERSGSPWHQDPDGAWSPTGFCVLGMGKHGGQELNYSSDVDLLFVYADEGFTFRDRPKRKSAKGQVLASHTFFKRLGESLIKERKAQLLNERHSVVVVTNIAEPPSEVVYVFRQKTTNSA